MYINRGYEEQFLEDFYKSDAQLACVYGRQGMGKTTLLLHFLENKKSIYFQAYPTTGKEALYLFSKAVGVESKSSLEEILNEITLDEVLQEMPLLLVIDQYPDFIKADSQYEEILHTYITKIWKGLPIKVIFCGDSYTHMEKYLLGKKSIWKGTLCHKLEIKAMSCFEAEAFFPEKNPEELVLLYGISGGIPQRMEAIYGMDIREAIQELYLDGKRARYMWPKETMQIELRELSYYNRLLSCLAKGYQRVNQISAEVEKPKDVVVPYMSTLISIGMVAKENPVTEPTNRKKTRYSIVNSADEFWYRYMPNHMDVIYQDDDIAKEELLDAMLEESDSYLKTVFINICKDYLKKGQQVGLPFTLSEIGNWWVNDEEKQESIGFDIVGLGQSEGRDTTVYAMCYYHEKPIEIHELKHLIELTKQLQQEGDVYYIIFAKAGFHENAQTVASTIKNIMLISLADIFPNEVD